MTGASVDLVLLPGLDGTGELFAPLLPRLPGWIRPVVVSYPRDVPLGYEQLKAHAARALPAGRPFAILGESFGGPLAVMLADERPPGLLALILCATFVKKPFRTVPAWMSVASVAPIYRLWPALLRVRSLGAGPRVREELLPLALRAIASVRPEVLAERVKALLAVDVEAALARSELPLLYLLARGDYLIRRHNLEGIRRLRPDVRVAEIDTLHFLLQLEPQRAADEIAAFLAGAAPPRVAKIPLPS